MMATTRRDLLKRAFVLGLAGTVRSLAHRVAAMDLLRQEIWPKARVYGTYHVGEFPSVQAALMAAGAAKGGTVVGDSGTTYAQTTTLSVPAAVTLSGVVLSFTGTPDFTYAAVRLDDVGATIKDCTITITAADYRCSVKHRASNTRTQCNTINHSTPSITAPSSSGDWSTALYMILAAMTGMTMTGIVIEDNDCTMSNVHFGDGVQASRCPGIIVRGNHFHDFAYTWPLAGVSDEDNAHFWGVYLGADCQDGLVENNRIINCAGSGIHHNLGATVAAALAAQPGDYGRRVLNNTVRDCIHIGIAVDYANKPEVAGNTVERCDLLMNNIASVGARVHDNFFGEVVNRTVAIGTHHAQYDDSGISSQIYDNVFGVQGTSYMSLDLRGAHSFVQGNMFLNGSPPVAINIQATAANAEVLDVSTNNTNIMSCVDVGATGVLINGVPIAATATTGRVCVRLGAGSNRISNSVITGSDYRWDTSGAGNWDTDND